MTPGSIDLTFSNEIKIYTDDGIIIIKFTQSDHGSFYFSISLENFCKFYSYS